MPTNNFLSQRMAIASAAVALFMGALNGAIVSIALPTIASSLQGVEHLSWIIVAYLLSATVAAPICGKLGDIYGRKSVLLGSILLFLAGSAAAALAWSIPVMAAARFVQGLGGGALTIAAMTAVAEIVEPEHRARIQSRMISLFTVSSLVGPFVGGAIIEVLSWHWIFILNLPVGGVVFVAILFSMKTKHQAPAPKPKIDYAGLLLLSSGLIALVLCTTVAGSANGWTSLPTLALGAAAVLLLVLFVLAEGRAADPVLPLSLFRNNSFSILNLANFLVAIAMYAEIIFLPVYLQVVKGLTPTQSGLYMLPMMIGMTLSLIWSGNFVSDTGRAKVLLLGGGLLTSIGFAALATMDTQTDLLVAAIFMLTVGVGMGPILSVSVPLVQNAVPERMLGSATAALSMGKQIGGSLGSSVVGILFALSLTRWAAELDQAGVPRGEIDHTVIGSLDEAGRQLAQTAVSQSIQTVFIVATLVSLSSLLVLFAFREAGGDRSSRRLQTAK